jgi:hypothetical protein
MPWCTMGRRGRGGGGGHSGSSRSRHDAETSCVRLRHFTVFLQGVFSIPSTDSYSMVAESYSARNRPVPP